MKQPLTLKTRLLIPVFGLIAVILLLSGLILFSSYPRIHAMDRLGHLISLGHRVSGILHALQIERGLSVGYIAASDETFLAALKKQRVQTDRLIQDPQLHSDNLYPDVRQHIQQANQAVRAIYALRKAVDSRRLSTDEILRRYSRINQALLGTISAIVMHSEVSSVARHVLAYTHFLYLQEYAGLERAEGVILLADPHRHIRQSIRLAGLAALQKEHELFFLQYASADVLKRYRALFQTESMKRITRIEQMMAGDARRLDIQSKQWFDLMTDKINRFEQINTYFKNDIQAEVEGELRSSQRQFQFVLALMLLSLGAFGVTLVVLLRLIREEQRLRLVTEKYIISSTTDTRGVITDASQAFCDISGYSKEELIGRPHNIVRHPDTPSEVFAQMWDDLKAGKSWRGKVKNRKKDGGFYWVFANIEPLYNARGQINAYIAIRLDITESELLSEAMRAKEAEYRTQQELLQQQHRLAQMGEMLSMIAHQWRQPLSAISAAAGSIQLKARLGKLDPDTAKQIAGNVQRFSQHLSDTIDDFRDFFKPTKSRTRTTYPAVLDGVQMLIDTSLERHGIAWREERGEIVHFWTYENELKQVVLNLVKNAEDILRETGVSSPSITVRIDAHRLEIEDNGGGIPEAIIDQIFDPYFSTKDEKNGTGLGLYMSKLIIEDHCKGSLSVHNAAAGACFVIELPVGEEDG